MSTARFNTLRDVDGNNPMSIADLNQGRAKAWANFNGSGVVAVRDSFNISSLFDNGVGNYSTVFTQPRPSANFVIAGSAASPGVSNGSIQPIAASTAAAGIGVVTVAASPAFADLTQVQMACQGNN